MSIDAQMIMMGFTPMVGCGCSVEDKALLTDSQEGIDTWESEGGLCIN